jgi:Tol biopolymer transport system component
MNGDSGLSIVSVASGEERKLTAPPRGANDDDCAFSTDGKFMAFVRSSAPTVRRLYVASSNGADPREITPEPSTIVGTIAWVPGKAEVVAATNRDSWISELVRFDVSRISSSGLRRIPETEGATSPTLVRPATTGPVRLAYQRWSGDQNIYSLDLTPSPDVRKGSGNDPVRIAQSTRDEEDPDFSPDGSKIALASARSGRMQIWSCDRDGSNLVQLTSGDCIAGSPRWSPDGSRLAFDCSLHSNFDVYTIPSSGGPPRRITSGASDDSGPSWSRDGRWIYFSSNRSGSYQIWKAPAEGGPAIQVTRNGGYEPFESPDGKLLYYTKRSVLGLWNMPVNGGPETQVLDSVRYYWWAMADSGIYFVPPVSSGTVRSRAPVKFFSFDTRTVTLAAFIEGELYSATRALAARRDGRRILFLQTDHPGSDIEMIEDFR